MATKKKQSGAAGSVKPARGKGRPFEKGNAHAWQPGRSGNPSGGSKAQTLSAAYRHQLKEPLPDDPTRTYADAVAETLCKNAVLGDVGAAKELADRTEGKPKQSVDLSVDQQRQSMIERAIEELMQTHNISREKAIETMLTFYPEAKEWIH